MTPLYFHKKILHQLLLGNLLALFPLVMLLYFLVINYNTDIRATRLELQGLELLQLLNQLAQDVALAQDEGAMGASLAADRIKNSFSTIEQWIEENGRALKITQDGLVQAGLANLHPARLRALWTEWQNGSGARTLEPLARDRQALFRRVGDTSNLILDPDLDSYYLMELVLLDVPQLRQHIVALLQPIDGKMVSQQRSHYLALMQADEERITHAVTTALREDENFYGVSTGLHTNLPSAWEKYQTILYQFTTQLRMEKSDDATQLQTLARAVQTENLALWQVAHKELSALLHIRMTAHANERNWHVFISLLGVLAVQLWMAWFSHDVKQRLSLGIGAAGRVAGGDLTLAVPVRGQDEIGQMLLAMQSMTNSLRSLIRQIQQSGVKISSSANELAATARQQETIMHHQTNSTSGVLLSVEEIADVARDLAQTVQRVAQLVQTTANTAQTGQNDLSRMTVAIHHMQMASGEISNKFQSIREQAQRVTSVITTITKVADQTNLLSLNAAIEAEKAGEYGRGFTVVAQEIRRLADQAAVATLDIAEMIHEMQQAVAGGVEEMEKFMEKVHLSVEVVRNVSAGLGGITEQAMTLSPSFAQVREGVDFQVLRAAAIRDAMNQLNEETLQILESIHESHLAVAQLNDAVRGLNAEISRFQV